MILNFDNLKLLIICIKARKFIGFLIISFYITANQIMISRRSALALGKNMIDIPSVLTITITVGAFGNFTSRKIFYFRFFAERLNP